MFKFVLLNNKNGKKTTFLLNICLLNTSQQKFCLKFLTITLTMNKKQECQEIF